MNMGGVARDRIRVRVYPRPWTCRWCSTKSAGWVYRFNLPVANICKTSFSG